MLKHLFLALLPLLCMGGVNASPHLQLDNRTPASLDDLLDDPFLTLRHFSHSLDQSSGLISAYKRSAYMQMSEDWPLDVRFHEPTCSNEVGDLRLTGLDSFDHCKPTFQVYVNDSPNHTLLWWQLAASPDFSSDSLICNRVTPLTMTLTLSDLEETYLNSKQDLYIRARTNCSGWSSPHYFQVSKPAPVTAVSFSKYDDLFYLLTWEGEANPEADYLIFASNALDFIPSTYVDTQVNALNDHSITQCENNENLVAITKDSSLLIDGRYAYYRIITRDHGQLSIPSPIIRIYDQALNLARTCLKQDPNNVFLCERVSLPSCHNWRAKNAYSYNPFVPLDDWNALQPYFLPINHPVKDRLDRIFTKKRATASKESFEAAGFGKITLRQPTNIVVGKNPELKGYLVKAYLDSQPDFIDWGNWLNRILGAKAIKESIKVHGFKDFLVPQKWIYPLPEHPSPPSKLGYHRKNFILIVEDMHILPNQETLDKYKKKISKGQLKGLYTLLSELGLIDSIFPDNIPFTKSGKIAFIDTEHHHLWPVNYQRFKQFLSPTMQEYWQTLIDQK